MQRPFSLFAGILTGFVTSVATATVRYVSVSNTAPVSPYTNWASAATSIQNAVDAAAAGDQILVSNGVYKAGGRIVFGSMSNRVAVTKAMTVQSVNGPAVTLIQGYQLPGTINGDHTVRCVYLTNGAALVGFTLTNGATRAYGDALREASGGGVWCASPSATVSNCVIVGNSAESYGGGAFSGTLKNCTITNNNFALYGGGASSNTLVTCTLVGNSGSYGGGAAGATLTNCTLGANTSPWDGGGAYRCILISCTLTNNLAPSAGGAYYSTLTNCLLTGNSASSGGGGVVAGTLINCTLTDNSAGTYGGGANNSTLKNCLLYFNHASWDTNSGNYSGGALTNCCTTPLPGSGSGNLAADPQMASLSRLSAGSPCRGAGNAAYATGTDIDGEPWASPPSIGCDEFYAGALTGDLSVGIRVSCTNVVPGLAVGFAADIAGRASASAWDFGDGTVLSNEPYLTHSWAAVGDYPVVLWAYNNTYPDGVSVTAVVHVVEQAVHYVALGSVSPAPPYTNWVTAATNIQAAVDGAAAGDQVVVSNGVYGTGGRVVVGSMTNRVAVTKPLALRSLNGPAVTIIQGYQAPGTINGNGAVRCVYLGDGASLAGFTLSQGATRAAGDPSWEQSGGGVWCDSQGVVISNCIIAGNAAAQNGGGVQSGTLTDCALTGNAAGGSGGGASSSTLNNCALTNNSADSGGGAAFGTLNNCSLTGNSAANGGGGGYEASLINCTLAGNSANAGGGALGSALTNCTLVGNSASDGGGGGAYWCPLNNCIVYYNTAPADPNYSGGTLSYCCTTPAPGDSGSLTNEPRLADLAGGNLRLKPTSPCINAGSNAYASGADLDGNPRIVGDTVDMGAYEFQSTNTALFSAWLQEYGLPTDGSADYADTDGDGMNNWQEWIAGTNPTNPASVLALQAPVFMPPAVQLSWSSETNQEYFIQCADSLRRPLSFRTIGTNVAGLPGTTAFADATTARGGAAFYRVGTTSTNGVLPLLVRAPAFVPASATISWSSVTNRQYFVLRATNGALPPVFSLLRSNLAGLPGTTKFTDTNAPPAGPAFYRVGVGL